MWGYSPHTKSPMNQHKPLKHGVKGTGSRFSACSLIKLLFPTYYQFYQLIIPFTSRSQSVFHSRSVFENNLK